MSTVSDAGRPGWIRTQRAQLSLIVGVIVGLHIIGWSLYISVANGPLGAGAFAGAGILAYTLGIRHAFDADHIAAIDDTTRLMVYRGRRPVGVGFFFAMGHSSVVVALAVVVALVAGAAAADETDQFREIGGVVSAIAATAFLALVAVLNALVLRTILRAWRDLRRGRLDERHLESHMARRGLINRLLGGRARRLVRSSWHMYPLGILFGLGLETASEVTLLTLSASTAQAGPVPLTATLSLPLLFAAGMSIFDTGDGLLMSKAYSWSYRHPARKLYYNIATTFATIAAAAFISSVYLAEMLVNYVGIAFLAPYADLSEQFELLGYAIVAFFLLTWGGAWLVWRVGNFEQRYPLGGGGRRAEGGDLDGAGPGRREEAV
jgi:HoxN/HupN/NixA family high-affinity nickel-transporter